MSKAFPDDGLPNAGAADFTTTRWSVVIRAGRTDSAQAAAALDHLCHAYWYPLYAFARRYGRNPDDAKDSTQAFFLEVIEKTKLAKADPQRGRFRSWLLACFSNHLKQEDARQQTWKRGGNHPHISLDGLTAEERYQHEPAEYQTPATLYEYTWAFTLVQSALEKLESEYLRLGKADMYRHLQPVLTGDQGSYAELGAIIGQHADTARVTVHRLRLRYSELFRAEVAQTVTNETGLDEELRHLRAVLSG